MTTIGELNVRIGADIKKLERGLGKSKAVLRRAARDFEDIGRTLTTAITLPVAAFSAASVKAFDEQIKAETKLRTALKGNEKAFENLTKQASELQNATLFGDEATIEAASFLAQMQLNEQAIKRILPSVQDFATAQKMQLGEAAKLVAKSVGSSTNALSRYGIQIDGAVGSNERLESAVAALSTAFGGQAQAVAKEGLGPLTQLKNQLGDVSEAFGKIIVENLEPFKNSLKGLADTLSGLSERQKKIILRLVTMAATIGPVALGIAGMIKAYSSLKTVMLLVEIRTNKLIGSIRILIARFMALKAAQMATVIGVIAAAVGGAILLYNKWNKSLSNTEQIAQDANKEIAGQRAQVELLTATLEDETATLKQKQVALNQLKGISSEYFGHLKLAKGTVEGLTAAQDAYIQSILRTAKANAASKKLEELALKAQDLEDQYKRMEGRNPVVKWAMDTAASFGHMGSASNVVLLQLNAVRKEMKDVAKIKLDNLEPLTGGAGGGTFGGTVTGSGKMDKKDLQKKSGLEDLALITDSPFAEGLNIISEATEKTRLQVDGLASASDRLKVALSGYEGPVSQTNEALSKSQRLMEDLKDSAMLMAEHVGRSMERMAMRGSTSFAQLGKSALKAAADVLRANMIKGISAAIANALGKAGPFGLFLASAAGATAGVIFNKVISNLKVPAFAGGTPYAPGGLSLVGEDGPEVLNIPRGSKITPNHRMGNMMQPQFTISLGIRNEELVAFIEEGQRKRKRIGV